VDENERKKDNVYGENHPASEGRPAKGIREETSEGEGTGEHLERIRQEDAAEGDNSGGMGRPHTPRDGKTQGAWQHEEEGREGVDRS
jgi:hypothetical protein